MKWLGLGSAFAAWNMAIKPNHFKDLWVKMEAEKVSDNEIPADIMK